MSLRARGPSGAAIAFALLTGGARTLAAQGGAAPEQAGPYRPRRPEGDGRRAGEGGGEPDRGAADVHLSVLAGHRSAADEPRRSEAERGRVARARGRRREDRRQAQELLQDVREMVAKAKTAAPTQ